MPRWLCHITLSTVVLATLMMPSVQAQDLSLSPRELASQARFRPAPAGQGISRPVSHVEAAQPAPAPEVGVPAQGGYVHLGSSMYPSPQPNIPIWTGSTFIPTPALAPHEMLYPHTYRAMYPPFYHRVIGHYYWTPFGIKSHEKWQLQGTMVQVKYRSHYPHGFHPPRISTLGGPWE